MKRLKKTRYIWFLLKPYWTHGKMYMAISIAAAALLAPVSQVLTALLPETAINAVMEGQHAARIVAIVAFFSLGIAVVAVAQYIIRSVYSVMKATDIGQKITFDIYEKALYTDFKYYDNPEFFNMFSFAQEYFAGYASTTVQIFPKLIQAAVTMLAMGAIIAQAGPILLVITLIFVGLQSVFTMQTTKLSANFSVDVNQLFRPLDYIRRVLQQKENAAELRASRAGKKLLQRFSVIHDTYTAIYHKFSLKTMRFNIPQTLLSSIQNAIILLYIIIFVIDGDTSKIGLYASLTIAAGVLTSSISAFFDTASELFQYATYGEKIARFFEAKSVIEPVPPPPDAAPAPAGQYSVKFKDVSFGYENAVFKIEGLNLTIPAGGRVAIVGENGAGKSTLTKLLLRLYDVNSGSLQINGRDIREYDIHALRLRIGVAYQDVRVLAMSLRDNLTAYNDATDDELRKIMTMLGLDGFMAKIGGSLDTMVSREFTEDGAVLSGGEAQRVAIARLFTGSFGLLLLDEPSSALDPLAEYNLMKLILGKSNTATTIMVAHRLSTVRDFDVIYHMDGGKIIESGTHDELMAARGGYYEMFTRQAENYRDAQ
jgi:ATP-binding cassette subfamily B protein